MSANRYFAGVFHAFAVAAQPITRRPQARPTKDAACGLQSTQFVT